MRAEKKPRVALVGTQSLRGKEIKRLLEERGFPLRNIEFYDPDIKEEFSRLSEFKAEPKVIHGLSERSLEGNDLVFFAADRKTNAAYGRKARKQNFRAIDLGESFTGRKDVPLVVAGINDHLLEKKPDIVSNPHPVTIILSHLLHPLIDRCGLAKALAFILQPASAFDGPGVEELAGQSLSLLSGTPLPVDVFKQQVAFNLLSHIEGADGKGLSAVEQQVVDETRRVLGKPRLPLSLSMIQASQFHTYALMCFLELKGETGLDDLKSLLKNHSHIKETASDDLCSVSCLSVTGKDEVFIGRIKKEERFPRSFWLWAVADNLTRGSALNAYEIAKAMCAA